jgi:hypothetical protein
VFVSSLSHDGALGGLTGADAFCQDLADSATPAPLPGTYLAWLSDVDGSPSTRFRHVTVPYVRVDGVVVAQNWNDLTDGFLANPISRTENNTPPSQIRVWTNTATNGAAATTILSCGNWLSNSDQVDGGVGDPRETNNSWTGTGGLSLSCDDATQVVIYCFQQH